MGCWARRHGLCQEYRVWNVPVWTAFQKDQLNTATMTLSAQMPNS
jgi:hypothetical protein